MRWCLTSPALIAGSLALAASSSALASPARELVTKYCVGCHNQKLKTANIELDIADTEHVADSAETWEKVIVKLRSRSMPPVGLPRPDGATYRAVAGWLESELDRAAAVHPNPGRPSEPLGKASPMLGWALVFLVIALIAGLLGFAGIAGAAAGIAKILFYIFLVLLVVSLIMHMIRGRTP